MQSVDDILELFQMRGNSQYGGEAVTQLEHALQCADLAESEHSPAALIVAALLHDLGHLLHDKPADAPDQGMDDFHENSGYHFVRRCFADEVAEPVRLHVAAKRYLCAVDANYLTSLSRPSVVSLQLQGGPMTTEEIWAFQENPFSAAAVRLRLWDDAAKIPQKPTPPLSHFAAYLRQQMRENPTHDSSV